MGPGFAVWRVVAAGFPAYMLPVLGASVGAVGLALGWGWCDCTQLVQPC